VLKEKKAKRRSVTGSRKDGQGRFAFPAADGDNVGVLHGDATYTSGEGAFNRWSGEHGHPH
jgi:hypothetical protein